MEPLKEFKPVPLQPVLNAAQKNHLSAIYRRPQRTVGPYDEEIHVVGPDGMPLWDLTTPLPVSRHQDWLRKGYEYVTLADKASLEKAAPFLAAEGLNARDYVQHPHYGAWNPKLYAASAAEGDRAAVVRLFELLDKYGVEQYEDISGTKVSPALLASWTKSRAAAGDGQGSGVGSTTTGTSATHTSTFVQAPGVAAPRAASKPPSRKKPAAAAKPKPAPAATAATITPPGGVPS